MAMTAGSCTAVAGSPPTFTGTGMSVAIAQALYPILATLAQSQMSGGGFAAGVSTTLTSSALFTIAQGAAAMANGVAAGVVPYITAHAEVPISGLEATVTSQVLGRTPSPNNANTNIQPPSSSVPIPCDISGGATSLSIQ